MEGKCRINGGFTGTVTKSELTTNAKHLEKGFFLTKLGIVTTNLKGAQTFTRAHFSVWMPWKARTGPEWMPTVDSSELEGLCRQTETQKDEGLESWFLIKANLYFYRWRMTQTSKLNPKVLFSLSISLSLSIVFVCLYSWCCNHGFFPEDYLWCALFLYEMIWYIFLSLFSCFLFFLFLWQYLCMWLSHYAPQNGFNLVTACLIVGGDWELINDAY